MAASGYTPISLYYSITPSQAPVNTNLVRGELAINIADGKLYYKDDSNVVKVIAGTGGTGVVAGSNTQVQFNNNGVFGASSGMTWDGSYFTATSIKDSALTSGRVTYAGTSGVLQDSTNLTFNGTTLTANTLNLTNQLTTAYGGTGLTSYTAGDLPYYATGTALSKLAIGTSKKILTSSGTAPQWTTNLDTTQGGTGLTTYTAGDISYYATGTTLSKLGIGAANYVLTSSGSAPQWVAAASITVGAAGSNTQIQFNNSGVLGAAAGLTWASSTLTASNITTGGSLTLSGGTANSVVYLNASKVATTTSTFSYTATGLGVGTSLPLGKLHVVGGNSNNIIADNNGEQYTTVQWYNNGVEKAQQYWDQTNSLFVSGTDVSAAYVFKTNATERMRIAGSTGNVSIGTASTPIKFLVNGTDAVGLPVGTTLQRPTGAAGYVRFNSTTTEFEGYNGTAWASIGGSAISNDTTTATAAYPLFAGATSGTALTVYTSNAKLLYTPSTGEFQATVFKGAGTNLTGTASALSIGGTATNAVNLVSGGTIASNVTATTQSAGTNNTTVATTAYVLANSVNTFGSGCVYENSQTITTDYTMTTGKNGQSAGPITIADGVTVTIPTDSNWVIN